VNVETAIFTANIHTSLYENSLIMELLQDEELVAASITENRHRIEIEPIQLA